MFGLSGARGDSRPERAVRSRDLRLDKMAAERSRRSNAGKNIAKLLQREEELDDFYSSAYGGFQETSGDEVYESEEEEEDVVDSDFDQDDQEGAQAEGSDDSEASSPPQRKKAKLSQITARSVAREKARRETDGGAKEKAKPAPVRPKTKQKSTAVENEERVTSLRKSTLELAKERKEQRKLREKRRTAPSARPKRAPDRPLTQEELLKEARITEIENLKSLDAFVRLEEEKKKVVDRKRAIKGPTVRYISTTMPLISPDEEVEQTEMMENVDIEGTASAQDATAPNESEPKEYPKYSRNFVVFSDSTGFPSSYFPTARPKIPKRQFCPVTGLPAKYFDPVTQSPYSTAEAFKLIRSRYANTEQQKCEQRLLQLSSWLNEKKKMVETN